jgi:hypothetical protein
VALAALGATFTAFMADAMRKTTVIMYDLDQDASASYQGLVDAATALGGGERLWHIPSRAVVLDRKYHAGAQSEVRRASTTISVGSMPFVKCNLDVPSLQVGRQTLYFMPDRMLIFDAGSVGGLGYSSLRVQQQHVTCVEPEDVPSDSRVVGRTWRFVNKSGGPDRRFRDNRELPICEYDAISFTSDAGLNELLHSSRLGVADKLIRYLSDGAALAGGADRGSGPKSLFS